jgi:uncharacterized Ntn-hydrolase superfamily protein
LSSTIVLREEMGLRFVVCFVFSIFLVSPAWATWSVVAVDPATGEVGVASASCSTGVRLIAGVVPGKGVVAAQAATSFLGRDTAVEMIAQGDRADIVLELLGDEAFYDSPIRIGLSWLQYGVATLLPTPKAGNVTGNSVPNDWGSDHGDDFSVQGNTLRPGVVDAMASTWRLQTVAKCRLPLAERLLRTLEAGRDAGGDNRCPIEASSLAAFLVVAKPDDAVEDPFISINTPRTFSGLEQVWHIPMGYTPDPELPEPVAHLRELYNAANPDQPCPE